MAVKDYGSASGSITIGRPVVHPAIVDLRGKVYEYVTLSWFWISDSWLSVLSRSFYIKLKRNTKHLYVIGLSRDCDCVGCLDKMQQSS